MAGVNIVCLLIGVALGYFLLPMILRMVTGSK
jgi:hypothetical protein